MGSPDAEVAERVEAKYSRARFSSARDVEKIG
jgi:hypothetical protein